MKRTLIAAVVAVSAVGAAFADSMIAYGSPGIWTSDGKQAAADFWVAGVNNGIGFGRFHYVEFWPVAGKMRAATLSPVRIDVRVTRFGKFVCAQAWNFAAAAFVAEVIYNGKPAQMAAVITDNIFSIDLIALVVGDVAHGTLYHLRVGYVASGNIKILCKN